MSRGTKMSLSEFVGPSQSASSLPTGPRERGPDDDGSFKRYPRRNNHEEVVSRGDQDSSWRRGGGGGGGGGYDRGGGGGYDRGGGGGYNRDGGRYNNSRGRDDRGGGWRGGGGYNDRGDDRGYNDRGDDRVGSWRGGGGGGGFRGESGGGERPRLQLKARTSPKEGEAAAPKTSNPFGSAKAVDTASKLRDLDIKEKKSEEVESPQQEEKSEPPKETTDNEQQRQREPEVINSRAAAFGAAPEGGRSNSDNRRTDRGPPPVRNKRFEQLAEEERNRGPPPEANSRFAAAAAADRSYRDDNRGPPPVANSRFSALADDNNDRRPMDQGPPPVANSRFAAAAAMAEHEAMDREERRRDRDAFYNRNDNNNRGPPVPTNSRFAAAAAADDDYVSFEDRERRMTERRMMDEDGRGGRFGEGRYGDDGGRFGGGYDDRRRYGDRYDDRPPMEEDIMPKKKSVDDVLKPKAPPVVDNVLKAPVVKPAPEHEEFMLKVPTKKEEKEEIPPAVEEAAVPEEPAQPTVSKENQEKLLEEFASGNKVGDELKSWVDENRLSLPSVEEILLYFLTEHEKLNPDVDCAWAERDKFGTAFVSLVGDDLYSQMQVLWAVQRYCDKLGFPKYNDEYVVQAMFRSMYKYDLAADEAFLEWKEDESSENNHETGKIKAIIQTVDWFNWLEDDDDDEEGEEEEYEEEEEE